MSIGDYRFLSKLDNSVKWCFNIFQWNLNEQAGQLFPVMLTAFGHAKGLFPQTTIIKWLRKISPNKQLFDKWDQFDEYSLPTSSQNQFLPQFQYIFIYKRGWKDEKISTRRYRWILSAEIKRRIPANSMKHWPLYYGREIRMYIGGWWTRLLGDQCGYRKLSLDIASTVLVCYLSSLSWCPKNNLITRTCRRLCQVHM